MVFQDTFLKNTVVDRFRGVRDIFVSLPTVARKIVCFCILPFLCDILCVKCKKMNYHLIVAVYERTSNQSDGAE